MPKNIKNNQLGIRPSNFASLFYPSQSSALTAQLQAIFQHQLGPKKPPLEESKRNSYNQSLIAGIAPHAGISYSGPCASHFYQLLSQFNPPDIFIILSTSHSSPHSYYDNRNFSTPLGLAKINQSFLKAFQKISSINSSLKPNHFFSDQEHSVEVQLPFLQHLYQDNFTFFPIIISQDHQLQNLAQNILRTIKKTKLSFCLICSADLTHYGPNYGFTLPVTYNQNKNDQNKNKRIIKDIEEFDQQSINLIKNLDPKSFDHFCSNTGATLCGHHPIIVLQNILNQLNSQPGNLLSYYNSSQISGDCINSVSYASIEFRKKQIKSNNKK